MSKRKTQTGDDRVWEHRAQVRTKHAKRVIEPTVVKDTVDKLRKSIHQDTPTSKKRRGHVVRECARYITSSKICEMVMDTVGLSMVTDRRRTIRGHSAIADMVLKRAFDPECSTINMRDIRLEILQQNMASVQASLLSECYDIKWYNAVDKWWPSYVDIILQEMIDKKCIQQASKDTLPRLAQRLLDIGVTQFPAFLHGSRIDRRPREPLSELRTLGTAKITKVNKTFLLATVTVNETSFRYKFKLSTDPRGFPDNFFNVRAKLQLGHFPVQSDQVRDANIVFRITPEKLIACSTLNQKKGPRTLPKSIVANISDFL